MAVLAREFPAVPMGQLMNAIALIMRHGKTHGRLACAYCNGEIETDQWEKRNGRLRASILKAYQSIGGKDIDFGGDPRGNTVKLVLPSGRSNNWGNEAWGVPNS